LRSEPGRCPVCQAKFRGVMMCSRCGADLRPLMLLAVEAWRLRTAARTALHAGQIDLAIKLAEQAQDRQATAAGEGLRAIGAFLAPNLSPGIDPVPNHDPVPGVDHVPTFDPVPSRDREGAVEPPMAKLDGDEGQEGGRPLNGLNISYLT
jgi:hypothetical protein